MSRSYSSFLNSSKSSCAENLPSTTSPLRTVFLLSLTTVFPPSTGWSFSSTTSNSIG